ncbi:MAG: hypothetical protein IT179_21510 [Acidobacteria bacterium]|nr:hypothetical protein [Acidobacteriota bacterium]
MTARARSLCAGASLLACAGQAASLQAAQPALVSPPAVAVDVTVTHLIVQPDGSQSLSAPPTAFTLERRHTPSGWTTVMVYRRAPAGAIPTPLDGARIEYADGARGVKVYDQDGRLNPRLSLEGERGLAVPDGAAAWLDALVADPRHAEDRLLALRRRYGAPAGRIRGLHRFVAQNGDRTREVLADARTGVVTESSVTLDGELQERTRFEYQRRADGSLFRHTIRTEYAQEQPGQGRAIVTMAFDNLTVGSGR